MQAKLSDMERGILDYIVEYLRENTYQPSIREIGKKFGIKSTKTVSEHLQALAEKGYVERDASRSRGVRVLDLDLRSSGGVRVPVYGNIAAGRPALHPEGIRSEYVLDSRLTGDGSAFFLRVSGESMEGFGILDGDLILVDPAAEDPANGEIVAARIGREGTVKRYFKRDGEVVLEAGNPRFAPVLVREQDDFELLGRVVGLYRRLDGPPAIDG